MSYFFITFFNLVLFISSTVVHTSKAVLLIIQRTAVPFMKFMTMTDETDNLFEY